MALVKSVPKKVLAKKLFYLLKICPSPRKIVFLGKTFLAHMYTFEIRMKEKADFLYTNRPK
jgi:hypothetical protein